MKGAANIAYTGKWTRDQRLAIESITTEPHLFLLVTLEWPAIAVMAFTFVRSDQHHFHTSKDFTVNNFVLE